MISTQVTERMGEAMGYARRRTGYHDDRDSFERDGNVVPRKKKVSRELNGVVGEMGFEKVSGLKTEYFVYSPSDGHVDFDWIYPIDVKSSKGGPLLVKCSVIEKVSPKTIFVLAHVFDDLVNLMGYAWAFELAKEEPGFYGLRDKQREKVYSHKLEVACLWDIERLIRKIQETT